MLIFTESLTHFIIISFVNLLITLNGYAILFGSGLSWLGFRIQILQLDLHKFKITTSLITNIKV